MRAAGAGAWVTPSVQARHALGTDDGEHAQLRGHDVEAFRAVLADPVHLSATTRALLAVRLDDLFDPRQARRKVSAVALRGRDLAARRFARGGPAIALRFDLGLCGLEILKGELPVVLAELLGLFAMHDMVQLGDEVLEPLDDLLQIGGFRRQRRVRSQQFRMLAQEIGNDSALVLGQARKVDLGGRRHAARIPRTAWNNTRFRRRGVIPPRPVSGLPAHGPGASPGPRTGLELHLVQRHHAVPDSRPGEGGLFQALVGHHEPGPIPEQDL